jgi:hypothetical protein
MRLAIDSRAAALKPLNIRERRSREDGQSRGSLVLQQMTFEPIQL